MTPPHLDEYDQLCMKMIAEHGWMVQGVFPRAGDDGEPFSYTVGLTLAGLPELVISGLPAELAGGLLNTAAQQSLTEEFTAGQVLTETASVPLRAVEAPTAEVNMARRLYPDHQVRALQLVWPDAGGAFPGDPTWSLGTAQPVFTTAGKA